jgi:hypothetical protein
MNSERTTIQFWLFPCSVCSGITLFSATYFICADRARLHLPDPYDHVLTGTVLFCLSTVLFTHLMLPRNKPHRLLILSATAIGETLLFFYGLGFLLLNLYGS